jgi:hypothetical protein
LKFYKICYYYIKQGIDEANNIMARQLKTKGEFENTFVDDRVKYLLPKFEQLTVLKPSERRNGSKGGEKQKGYRELAVNESIILKQRYPDDRPEDEKTYSTIVKRQIPALNKAFIEAIKTNLRDPQLTHPVTTIKNNFIKELYFLFRPYMNRVNEIVKEERAERNLEENRIEVDLTDALNKAYEVLTTISNGATLKDVEWRDVSCALALASGRRMSEIHLSAKFEKVDNYTVSFKGQLKGKSRRIKTEEKSARGIAVIDATFEVPTLIPSELVVKGLDWLATNGKRVIDSEDPEIVNRRYCKVLNLRTKDSPWAIMEEMTYHKFRACYLLACITNNPTHSYDYFKFAKKVLCDDANDAISAYERFTIKEGSLSKI